MYFSIKIGNKIIQKFVDKQVASKMSFSLEPQKAITIGEVLKSILKYTVYIVGIGSMLYDVLAKIPVAVVSAGGFAIGLGAQSLVKDLINGFFILFEDIFCRPFTIRFFLSHHHSYNFSMPIALTPLSDARIFICLIATALSFCSRSFRIGSTPLLRCHTKQSNIKHIRFRSICKTLILFR